MDDDLKPTFIWIALVALGAMAIGPLAYGVLGYLLFH